MAGQKLILALALVACFCAAAYSRRHEYPITGGLGDEKPADGHIRSIINQAMSQIRSKYPHEFESMDPISYRMQMVAGTNYFVKVLVTDKSGNTKHAHIRLYESLKNKILVDGIIADVKEKDPIEHFNG